MNLSTVKSDLKYPGMEEQGGRATYLVALGHGRTSQ
jgi:hypothetical protein